MEIPKTPQAKRKANDKWDKENMITLGCKVKKTEAIAFKEYSAQQGKTANTVLKDYVIECIKNDEALALNNALSNTPKQDESLPNVEQ